MKSSVPKSKFGGPPRQLRRPVPKATSGPYQGAVLTKGLVDGASFSEWGWVGAEIHCATDIGPQHRATACGFRKNVCKNKHAPVKAPSPVTAGADDDDIVIISDDEPECSTKACKSNPNCCNFMGQAKWQHEASARKLFLEVAGLGPDPKEEARVGDHPVGLKNLGATCYANSIVQVWFRDLEFRRGVYKCAPELSLSPRKTIEESPMYQLQVTFGMLQESTQKSFNPVKFVECLGIRAAEQQDAQEFSKLFMSHLDNEFKKQQDIPLQSLITNQFEGKQVYGTRCTRCNKSSEHQSSFLELEISLTPECKLEERLEASMEDEKLEGDNQYDCSTCSGKQDAFRYQRITQLPPVLHFSVLRFVFDHKDMERKKSKQAINYPLAINMRTFVGGEGGDIWYDLRGVLLHRGSSAYHGHYEAQVFDVSRNKWFLFNDEEVKEIEGEDLLGKRISGSFRSQGSKDAYMLIYGQRSEQPTETAGLDLPEQVLKAVRDLNAEHSVECGQYIQRRENLESEFETVRSFKQEIYQSWHISAPDEISAVLSREDLEGWLVADLDATKAKKFTRSPTIGNDPPPSTNSPPLLKQTDSVTKSSSPPSFDELIRGLPPSGSNGMPSLEENNIPLQSPITCFHGLLDPAKSAGMKRISKNAWERMEKSGVTAVALESNQICEACAATQFNEKLYFSEHAKALIEFDKAMNDDKSRDWWISRAWLKDWKLKRPKMHKPGLRDPIPNIDQFQSDVYCEHGGLVNSQKSREKISAAAVQVLQAIFPEFEPPNDEAGTCSVCETAAANDREVSKEARIKAEAERNRLTVLARKPLAELENLKLTDGIDYHLLPYSFVKQWRAWISKPLTAPRPGPIPNEQFICSHNKLLVDPTEPLDVDGIVCDVAQGEWDTLHELYGGGPAIQCSIEDCFVDGKDKFWTSIPLCGECRTKRLSNLDNVGITVYRLAEGELLPWIKEPPATPPNTKPKSAIASDVIDIDDTDIESPTLSDSSPPARAPGNRKRAKPIAPITYGQRKSKRLRTAVTTKRGTTFSISVSEGDTVRDIKRKIESTEDVLPFYQQLYLKSLELTDDDQTVTQIGLLRTDRLILRAIEAMDEDDAVAWALSSGDAESRPVKPRVEGRAFGGTLLDGSMHAVSGGQASDTKVHLTLHDKPVGNYDHPMDSASDGPTTPKASKENHRVPLFRESSSDLEQNAEMKILDLMAPLPCPRCTYLNNPGTTTCEICEESLP